MSQTQAFSQFTIEQQLKRKIKVFVPSLYGSKERANILQIILMKRDAIENVDIELNSNSVEIFFDPEKFSKESLLSLLESVLFNFSQKPSGKIKTYIHQGDEKELVFGINGMSCASCALFLEMLLSREGEGEVSINYKTEIAMVKGYLSKDDIFKIIEDNGYHAYLIGSGLERDA